MKGHCSKIINNNNNFMHYNETKINVRWLTLP